VSSFIYSEPFKIRFSYNCASVEKVSADTEHRVVTHTAELSTVADAHSVCDSSLLPHEVNYGRFCFWRRQYVFFLFVHEISPESLNRSAPNSHGRRVLVPRSDEFEGQGQRSR